MPRYINDDAPVTKNLRQAAKISTDQLKNIMINRYNVSSSVKSCGAAFNPANYRSQSDELDDLMVVLSCDEQSVLADRNNINFDLENICTESPTSFPFYGDQGQDLCGLRTLSTGLTFCGAIAGGDWELPLFYILYYDGTDLRAYIPIKGNLVNCDTLTAFGSEVNLCNPNAPYNIVELYDQYSQKGFLAPSGATFDDFIDDSEIAFNSYLAQYGLQYIPNSTIPQNIPNNALGFNWDAIKEELETAIEVI